MNGGKIRLPDNRLQTWGRSRRRYDRAFTTAPVSSALATPCLLHVNSWDSSWLTWRASDPEPAVSALPLVSAFHPNQTLDSREPALEPVH